MITIAKGENIQPSKVHCYLGILMIHDSSLFKYQKRSIYTHGLELVYCCCTPSNISLTVNG
jgi:hypothetical protein